ncbi:MAG: MBL fold metallo-hydrolase [Clostridiales bacterium]|nr:MBL fold metallo-hydrolase [Clostridiales bacterium]
MARKKKNKFSFTKSNIIIFLILSVILISFTFIFKNKIEAFINKNDISNEIDNAGLVMHTIDVGQAEAIMIKLPDGKNMLIDSGNTGSDKIERLKSYLNDNYFASLNNKEIDYFIITHSDADHCGGASMIFENFKVNTVYRPNIFSNKVASEESIVTSYNKKYVSTNVWANTITSMYNEEDCEIFFSKSGIEIIEESYSIKFLAPTEDNYSNVNSYSPLIVVEYNNRRIMLTGDATIDTEEKAIDNLIECDVLNVAHHGSTTSTSVEFLAKVNPKYAVISCNSEDGNNYGHPHQEILNRLLNYMSESHIYRTDLNGNILLNIATDGDINVLLDVKVSTTFIRAEYILIALEGILFVVCFTVNYKNQEKN